jgi:hypothetical protein
MLVVQNGKPMKQEKLFSFGFLFSLGVLLLNDFFLKNKFPGIITGKISDFAGLFAFPFFFAAFFPKKRKIIYCSTFILFIIWKLPLTDIFIEFWNQNMRYSIGRIIDYTDYIALLILPVSYFYKPNYHIQLDTVFIKTAKIAIIGVSLFSFLATAGTHGRIKGFKLEHSKKEVNDAVKVFYEKNPNLKVPDEYEFLVKTHFYGNENDTAISSLNADSINYDFYIKEQNLIIWSSFVGSQRNWKNSPCEIVLEGYLPINTQQWRFRDDLTSEEKKEIQQVFESKILSGLKNILEK